MSLGVSESEPWEGMSLGESLWQPPIHLPDWKRHSLARDGGVREAGALPDQQGQEGGAQNHRPRPRSHSEGASSVPSPGGIL